MGRFWNAALAAAALTALCGHSAWATSITVRLPPPASATSLDGRLILVISPKATPEPREQVQLEAPLSTPFIFGQTVDGLKPGAQVVIGDGAYGWPLRRLSRLPEGDYTVQAVLNRYETFRRADGSVVKLPPDMGEGQHWNEKPGNLYSKPVRVHLGPAAAPLSIALDQTIPPSRARPTPSSSATSASGASFCPATGAGRCIWAPTSWFRPGSTRIRARASR